MLEFTECCPFCKASMTLVVGIRVLPGKPVACPVCGGVGIMTDQATLRRPSQQENDQLARTIIVVDEERFKQLVRH